MVIVIVTDFLAFVLMHTQKNESQLNQLIYFSSGIRICVYSFLCVNGNRINHVNKSRRFHHKKASQKGKALIGRFTRKHVRGALGGAAATSHPKAAYLKDRGDVIGSGAVAIGGGIAIRQVDEGDREVFVLTGMGVTGPKAVKQLIRTAKGATGKKKKRVRRSPG